MTPVTTTSDALAGLCARLPVPLLVVDRDGIVKSANAAVVELLETNPAGVALASLVRESPEQVMRLVRRAASSSEFLPGSLTFLIGTVRVNGAADGNGNAILHLALRAETHRNFLQLNDRLDQLAVEVEERRRAQALLAAQNEVLGMIAKGQPYAAVLSRLIEAIEQWFGGNVYGSVLLCDRTGRLRHGAAPHLPAEYTKAIDRLPISAAAGSCGTAAYRREPVIVTDIAADPLWADYRDIALKHGLRSCWSTPILSGLGEVVGTFAIYGTQPGPPPPNAAGMLAIAARTAALAIERHRAAVELSQVLERKQHMLDGLPAAIAMIEASGVVRSANRVWHEWLARTGAARFEEAFNRPGPAGAIRDVIEGRLPSFDGEMTTGSGDDLRCVRFTVAPVRAGEGGSDVIAMHIDITDRKRAEEETLRQSSELQRINAELKQFAWVASHDLREPLRTIKSFSQLFVRRYHGSLGSDADQFLDYITEAVTRMEDLIADLLIYSRVAHGPDQPPADAVDLNTVVEDAFRNLSASIEETGAEVMAETLPAVTGHRVQLTQLFQNLIANAIKYRGSDAPRIQVHATRESDVWRITVEDNGLGVPIEYHETIFGLFKRLHSRDVPGTGIGLALCRKIVESHGGSIGVESDGVSGSTFWFTLPA